MTGEEYKAVFDASPDGCLVVDADGSIRMANPRVEELFGWAVGELVGRGVEVLIPTELRTGHVRLRDRFVGNPHNRPMGVGLELRGQRRDGSTFPVEVSLSPWRGTEGGIGVVCAIRDVSSYRRLQNFSEGALRATEEERKRIARELHDDTAQRLATLILRVRLLADERDDASRRDLFEAVRAEIVEAAEGVKRMARGLRPPEIEEVGLALAVQAHIRSLREADSLAVDFESGYVEPYLDVTQKLAVYRIVQEALSNVRRHSEAPRARVRIARRGDAIVAEVSDRGKGFALANASEGQKGLGLIGMEERATMIGGRLDIETLPGKGTRVSVSVPVQLPEEENA